jgi:hypothetical protein
MITIVGTSSGATRSPVRDIVERAVDVTQVRKNFEHFLQNLKEIIDVEVLHVGTFVLDEVSFSAEISVSGDFKLLGVGTGIDAQGGVTFTLRQKQQNQQPQ